MSNNDNIDYSAVWYAYGRQDAEYNPLVDVFAFATFYVAQRATRGQSVQDAFATYVAKVAKDEARRQAAAAPVLADSDATCPCTPSFVDPRCPQHGAHEYHGVPAATQRCPEIGVRGTQCTQPAGHVDDCTFA
jgi:hypothetical protein